MKVSACGVSFSSARAAQTGRERSEGTAAERSWRQPWYPNWPLLTS